MRKIQLIGLTLVALVALGAFSASSFALSFEAALFLVAGVDAVTQQALVEGELTLRDVSAKTAILCSGHLEGHFEGAEDLLITDVLALGGSTPIGELVGTGLQCVNVEGCGTGHEVWPEKLPWLIVPELDIEDSKPWILIGSGTGTGLATYAALCVVLGINVTDVCEAVEGSGNEVINAATGVETAANVAVSPNGNCSVGGAASGEIKTDIASVLLSTGGVVSISTP